MTTLQMIGWYAAAMAGVLGSALVSGVETGIYTINRVRLHVLAHIAGSNAAVLERLLRRQSQVIVTLLVGNNLFDYLSSLAIGSLLHNAGYREWSQVGINAAILTPVTLVFGQIVPKDLFRSHSDLTYHFARPMWWLQKLLTITGIVPLVQGLTILLRKATGSKEDPEAIAHPRRVVSQLMRESMGHGVISPYQSNMIDRALEFGDLTVADVMQPWKSATTVRTTQDAEAVWSLADRIPYSRVPLLDPTGAPVGLIEVAQVLAHDPATCPPLETLARPIARLLQRMKLPDALDKLQRKGCAMGVVMEGHRPIGLVTVKDLVEPIVGELEVW